MTEKYDGGSAFPCSKDVCAHEPGMSLRDYFAATAMRGLVALCNQHTTWEQDARKAYEIADAMLEARKP